MNTAESTDIDAKKPHPVTIVIDTQDVVAPSREQTPRQLLGLVGKSVATDYLVYLKGKRERVSYQNEPDVEITLHEGMKFITVSLGPTPVS